MSGEERKTYYFADFEVDAARLELRRRGVPVSIQPKPFRLLLYLLEARERVVSKQELLAEVWSGVFVTESALSTTVRDLRRALGDVDPRNSAIRTVHGHGYRFGATVFLDSPEPGPDADAHAVLPAEPGVEAVALEERDDELTVLAAALADVRSGRGRACLLTGPAGIGKTSLVSRIAADGAAAGLSVCLARGHEDAAVTPFWIWTEILRSIRASCAVDAFEGWVEADSPCLRPLLSGSWHDEDASQLVSLSSEQVRFRFQGAFWRILVRAARERPLLIACEDLHWSDTSSLRVLRFVLDQVADAPLLIVGTLRESGMFDESGIKRVLGSVARSDACHKLSLQELSPRGVARAIERVVGGSASEALASKIHAATNGNPFFVSEIAKLLASSSGDAPLDGELGEIPLPESVSDVVGGRLADRSPSCRDLLELAAVFGSAFDVGRLGAASGGGADEILAGLSEAEREGFVVADGPGSDCYRFSHAIVREVVYDRLTHAQRLNLHARAAGALERLFEGREEEVVTELAHHYCAAGPARYPERALRYARAASELCERMSAWVEAERHCRAALKIARATDAREVECEILIAQARMLHLGDAEIGPASVAHAEVALCRARELALEIGASDALVRCATLRAEIELGRSIPLVGIVVSRDLGEFEGALEEALAVMGERVTPARAAAIRQLSRIAYQQGWTGRAEELCTEAIRISEANGFHDELMRTEVIVWERLGADRIADKQAILERLESYASAARGPDAAAFATSFRGILEMERGNVEAASRSMDQHRAIFHRNRIVTTVPEIFTSMLAALQGRFDDAERSIAAVVELHARLSYPMVATALIEGTLRRGLAVARGEPAEALPLIRMFAAMAPAPLPRIMLMHALMQSGIRAEAEALLEEIDVGAIPRDSNWLVMLAMLAEVSATSGHRETSSRLYGLLLPYADLVAMLGWFGSSVGSVSRSLALLASALGHDTAARKHFEQAIVQNQRMDARPWVARCQLEYARLLSRGDRYDRALSREFAAESKKMAESICASGLLETVRMGL